MRPDTFQAWVAFRQAYDAADGVTVLWCPTIDDRKFSGAGVFHDRERTGSVYSHTQDEAVAVLCGYFEAFSALRSETARYAELFKPIASAVAASCHADATRQQTRFADLAKLARYSDIVSRNEPTYASPSFGFWFHLEEGSPDLDFSLGFQIEATYERRKLRFNDFRNDCCQFIKECGQSALRLLLDSGAWELYPNGADHCYPVKLTGCENVWLLEARPVAEIVPHLTQDRLRGALEGRKTVEPPAIRWLRQAHLRGASQLGATLVVPPRNGVVHVRISGYSHWLFEALFPTTVTRLYESGQAWRAVEPPDPILMSAAQIEGKARVRFAMFEEEPEEDRCLCGGQYPSHPGGPAVVALREGAKAWIEQTYATSNRAPKSLSWNTLSSPRTYFDMNPEETSRLAVTDPHHEEVRASADLVWRKLLNTVFEGAPLEVPFAPERLSLSMTAECSMCKDACCQSGSPLVTAAERSRIVAGAGFEDFFVAAGDTDAFWIGKRRDGEARRVDAESGRFLDSCPYYEIGTGCLIHDWKPIECVLYPYRVGEEGRFVKLAVNCPSRATLTMKETAIAVELAGSHAAEMSEDTRRGAELYAGSWIETSEEEANSARP